MKDHHPTWEEIIDCVERPDEASDRVSRHLAACERCARVAGEMRRIFTLMKQGRLPEAPRAAVERAIDAVLAELARESQKDARAALGARERLMRSLSAMREVWATLVADSLVPGHVLRGEAPGAPRMLLYETEAFSVTLSLTRGPQGSTALAGQVSPRRAAVLPEGGRAILAHAGRFEETPLSEFGEFAFSGSVAAELSLVLGDTRIRLSLPEEEP